MDKVLSHALIKKKNCLLEFWWQKDIDAAGGQEVAV
jgi:hypothetical protein